MSSSYTAKRTAIVSVIGTALVGASLAACSPSSSSSSSPSVSASPGSSSSTVGSQVSAWYGGQGGRALDRLGTDLQKLSKDALAGDVPAAGADGVTLSRDATLAASLPPPVDPSLYASAMTDYAAAGTDAQNGDYAGATTTMESGTSLIGQVTADMKAALAP